MGASPSARPARIYACRSRRWPWLAPCHEGQPLGAADVVDGLEHAGVEAGELDAELLAEAGVVDEVVSGGLLASLVVERDLRVGQEPLHHVGQVAETHRDPTGVVEGVARLLG